MACVNLRILFITSLRRPLQISNYKQKSLSTPACLYSATRIWVRKFSIHFDSYRSSGRLSKRIKFKIMKMKKKNIKTKSKLCSTSHDKSNKNWFVYHMKAAGIANTLEWMPMKFIFFKSNRSREGWKWDQNEYKFCYSFIYSWRCQSTTQRHRHLLKTDRMMFLPVFFILFISVYHWHIDRSHTITLPRYRDHLIEAHTKQTRSWSTHNRTPLIK